MANKDKDRLIEDLTNIRYIIGLDPSLSCTGWSVLDLENMEVVEHGYFQTKSNEKMGIRLRKVYTSFKDIKKKYPNSHIIKEKLPAQAGKFTTIQTLQGLAACHGVISMYYPSVDDIHSLSIKSVVRKYLSLDGKDKISKEQVRDVMNEIYNLDIKNLDTSDSCAVIHTFLIKYNNQIDDDIKKLKKKIKSLKTQNAIVGNIDKINELEKRKVDILGE